MDDEMVSVAVAGQAAGVSERTVRRWVSAGHVSAVSAPGGRLVRLVEVTAYAAQVERRRTAAAQVSVGRPLSVEVSGRPADTDGQVSAGIVGELVATIERQAEEIGVLRERLRAIDASAAPSPGSTQPASVPPAAPVAPAPAAQSPPRPTRPVASLRVRVLRWLRA